MAFTGWLSFAGTELVNNARAQVYAQAAGIAVRCSCPDLAASLGDKPYVDPRTDDAPWVDASVPESTRFYGLVGLDFVGADSGTLSRQWTELLADGGVPGAMRRASGELEVQALMLAGDEAAMSYGISWLSSALRGSACQTGCFGDELCVYAACPERPLLPAPNDDDCLFGFGPLVLSA